MRSALAAAFLLTACVFLAACVSLTEKPIRAEVAGRVRIDGLRGERVHLVNQGPGELLFEFVREGAAAQHVKIAPGLGWDFALEDLRAIVVEHPGEGAGHVELRISGRSGAGIRVTPLGGK